MDELVADIPNVHAIADDILIVSYKEDGSDHDDAVRQLCQAAQKANMRFNKEKCIFHAMQVPFYSNLIT